MEKFNLLIVHDNFQTSLHDDDDVNLHFYLQSYEELNKFFNLMGTVFGFVSNDLRAKIDILSELLTKNVDNFQTVKRMIEYEKNNLLLEKSGYTSGSRTLLRLHRGLDFIRLFLKNIGEIRDEDDTGCVCREAYNVTLAKHHPFLIRKGAQLAMYTMPTRVDLLKKVCGDDEESINNAINVLPRTLEVTGTVFERIEKLYEVHNLHGLP
ncbi:ceramide-1-phosphate transfer protein [Onthophagus taurus]|uniref:ceramide-1-phosphate transfer protein n=1 Tax=Onthophagus taurus TaxID=166361 RepID=UPI000C20927C|nr:ceramide-1-phosphate transfer protein [Onthophagus taurus]